MVATLLVPSRSGVSASVPAFRNVPAGFRIAFLSPGVPVRNGIPATAGKSPENLRFSVPVPDIPKARQEGKKPQDFCCVPAFLIFSPYWGGPYSGTEPHSPC
jgi:hypothetical protein